MKAYVLERMKEPSTWRGPTLLLTALGIAGLIGALTPDK